MRHKRQRKWMRKNKRMKGRSIEERPAVVNDGTEIGHWEVDTVVGRSAGREAVVFTAVEKVTRGYIAIRIPGRTCAIQLLHSCRSCMAQNASAKSLRR